MSKLLHFSFLGSALVIAFLMINTSWAAQTEQGTPRTDAIKLHEQLTALHHQAAQCLKTRRSIDDCNNEMMKNCPVSNIPQCTAVSSEELRRHSKTHETELGGIKGAQPSQVPREPN